MLPSHSSILEKDAVGTKQVYERQAALVRAHTPASIEKYHSLKKFYPFETSKFNFEDDCLRALSLASVSFSLTITALAL